MDIIDSIVGGLDSAVDWIGNAISSSISDFFGKLCYYVASALCSLVKLVYEFFSVFAGIKKVEYDGQNSYLINIFFGNRKITNIYWGMALIGIVFVVAFLVVAVIRKMYDINDKNQRSMGAILLSGAKSVLIILLLSAAMSAVLNLTNLLVDRVSMMFDQADSLNLEERIDFTDEQYATMSRIMNTIGNYSLNASYNSRFNLSSCYNEIRADLHSLQEDGIFEYYYSEKDGITWQSALQRLVRASNPSFEMKIDDSNDATKVILEIMETLKTNASFYPVAYVDRAEIGVSSEAAPLDRVIFLSGTLNAAKNAEFNKNPSLTDALRGPFYYGAESDKNSPSIYDIDDVSSAFNIGLSGISYLLIGLMAVITLKNLVVCIFNCIARIFNLLGLYLIAPPLIATAPLDDGEKFKQWMTSAVVQTFGIFGCIIPMRLVLLFVPMIFDPKLMLFPSSVVTDTLAKALLVLGSIEAANRFGSIFTGILANNAGYEAVRAGDMRDYATGALNSAKGAALSTASFAANAVGVGAAGRWVGNKLSSMANTISEKGGIVIGSVRGIHGWNRERKQRNEMESVQERQKTVNMARLEADEKRYGIKPAGAAQQPANPPANQPANARSQPGAVNRDNHNAGNPAGNAGNPDGGNRQIPAAVNHHNQQ